MSIRWSFCSFDQARWDAVFGSKLPEMEQAIIDATTWDLDEEEDIELRKKIAHHICEYGLSYDGLTSEEADELDQMVSDFFTGEGLEEVLALEYESPECLAMSDVTTLIERVHTPQSRSAPFLVVRSLQHYSYGCFHFCKPVDELMVISLQQIAYI